MSSTNPPQIFHKFMELPPELRYMVWREFYLEPRIFTADLQSQADLPEPREMPEPNSTQLKSIQLLRWTLRPLEYMQKYYESIDRTINRESSAVARLVRREVWLPEWRNADECADSSIFTTPSPHTHTVWNTCERVCINWDVDFVTLSLEDDLRDCPPQSRAWLKNIRNLVMDGHGGACSVRQNVTPENLWLWQRREDLESLRRILRTSWTMADAFLLNEAAFFQTKYLLREAPGVPEGWRDVICETASYMTRLLLTAPPRRPRWDAFVEKLGSGVNCKQLAGLSEGNLANVSGVDEIAGARELFQEINVAAF